MRMRLDYMENEIRNHQYHVVDGVLLRDMYIFSLDSYVEEAPDHYETVICCYWAV